MLLMHLVVSMIHNQKMYNNPREWRASTSSNTFMSVCPARGSRPREVIFSLETVSLLTKD